MSGTTISTTITTNLQLNAASQNPVFVSDTGAIEISGSIFGGFPSLSSAIYGGDSQSWAITNDGTVISNDNEGSGIDLAGGGTVTNGSPADTSALVEGNEIGVNTSKFGTVANYGTIEGLVSGGVGSQGGEITNGSEADHAALITGGASGINAFGAAGVTNFGTIVGDRFGGVLLEGGGSLTNGSFTDTTALIENNNATVGYGVAFDGFLQNFGTIIGPINRNVTGADGVFLQPGSAAQTIINSGTIEAWVGIEGKFRQSSLTIENSGDIVGLGGTAINGVDFLVVNPGAGFVGGVTGSIQLELASGSIEGTLNGIGSSFTGFKTIAFDSGSSWLISGTSFGLAHDKTITRFAAGDTIILDGFTATSHTYVAGPGLELSNGVIIETLGISGSFNTDSFVITTNEDGTEIVVCFLRGTKILTQKGEVDIENLSIGDRVATRWRGFQPIKWVGRQSFGRCFVRNNRDQVPVKIFADAFGQGLPVRDLYVSPGHSILLEENLVLAKSLVNGVTIVQDARSDEIHYYQIELEAHDCVLADGCWAETYADCPGLRAMFHNAASFSALYPKFETPEKLELCAPRHLDGPVLSALLEPVVAIAVAKTTSGTLRGWIDRIECGFIRGWANDEKNPELPVLLDVLVDNEVVGSVLACEYRGDLPDAGIGYGRAGFSFNMPKKSNRPEVSVSVRRHCDSALLPFSHELQIRARAALGNGKIKKAA